MKLVSLYACKSMSSGSKDLGNEFVNGQERSFAARKQYITNLKTPLFQLLKSSWVKCPKTFRLEGVSHFFTLSPFHLFTLPPTTPSYAYQPQSY